MHRAVFIYPGGETASFNRLPPNKASSVLMTCGSGENEPAKEVLVQSDAAGKGVAKLDCSFDKQLSIPAKAEFDYDSYATGAPAPGVTSCTKLPKRMASQCIVFSSGILKIYLYSYFF